MKNMIRHALPATLVAALVLQGCGSSDSPTAVSANTNRMAGTAVVPMALTASGEIAIEQPDTSLRAKSEACPKVPDGYDPATGAVIEVLDAAGFVVTTTAADACGAYGVEVDTTGSVRIAPAGFQAVTVSAGAPQNDALISALPTGATVEIASLQYLGARQFSVLVIDSIAKKAIQGAQASAYALTVADQPVAIANVSTQTLTTNTESFSTVLVLDSSSSMTGCAANCSGQPGYDRTQRNFTQYSSAARAAHEFLNGKKASNEVALTFFSSEVFPITDASFVNEFADVAGTRTNYAFSADGFTTESAKLRLPIDHYNWRSAF